MRPASRLLASLLALRNVWHCPTCRAEHGEVDYPAVYKCFCGRCVPPPPSPFPPLPCE